MADPGQHGDDWRSALDRVLPVAPDPPDEPAEGPSEVPVQTSTEDLENRIDQVVLHDSRRYTRTRVHELTGLSPERTRTLWRAMGFADVADDEVMFNDGDVVALSHLAELIDTGMMSEQVQFAVVRTIAQAISGLATWQVERLYDLFKQRRDWAVDLSTVLPALEKLQSHVWRRHLAVAAGRLLATAPEEADIRTLTVGSSDLVGFTRAARRLSPGQLIELVELFHGIAADVVAEHEGRIVKTVGDAVLFVTVRPEDAAEVALELLDRTVAAPGLPELRTGLAVGSTLTRFGDIYGEVVDTAARLCTHALPGRILVDHDLARALEDDPRFRLRLRRPIIERGYPRLRPWGLRRAGTT